MNQTQATLLHNRYHLHTTIGSGGMGVVYRATDRLTGQTVALKRVIAEPGSFSAEQSSESFNTRLALAQEFQILASLRHPHIISVLDYGFDEIHQPFFTMDYLAQAQTILQAAKNQTVETKIRLILQVLQALTYLHRRQVLHNDLKPANILVTEEGVKLLDFGLSISFDQAASPSGTWAYMAPEMMRGEHPVPATDLYAVGVIAYELLAGKRPFLTITDVLKATIDTHALPPNPALTAVILHLLHKDPSQRFANAADAIYALCQATERTLPPESQAIRESFLQAAQFTGRKTEFHQLIQWLHQTLNGRGSAHLIAGESGVGKSRLLNELVPAALVGGALVLRGQTIRESSLPYALWQTAVRRLCLVTPPDPLEASLLQLIVPDLAQLLNQSIPPQPNITPDLLQKQLAATFLTLFTRQQQPLLILLEDLHWASAESLILLHELSAIATHHPMLIIGSYRDDETPNLPTQLPHMPPLPLLRLDEQAIADLSASMLGQAGCTPELFAYLQQQTEGNAFFLVEIVRTLAEEAGQLQEINQITLPETIFTGGVRDVVQRRLSRIQGADRLLLQQAAVLGRRLNLPVLHTIFPQASLNAWLTRAAETAVLNVQDGEWQFAHDKLRDGLLHELTSAETQHLHQQAAIALEQTSPDPEQLASILAFHWRQANQPHRERPYALKAGIQSIHSHAYHDAITHLERALALQPNPSESATIQRYLGQAYTVTGSYDIALHHLHTARQIYTQLQDPAGLATTLFHLSNVSETLGHYAEAIQYGQQSLTLAQEINDPLNIARAYLALGAAEHRLGDTAAALAHHQQCLAIAQQINDPWIIARAYNNIGSNYYHLADYENAATNYHQSLDLCKQMGHKRGISTALNNLALIAERQQDYETATHHHRASLQIKQEIGDRFGISVSLMNLGVIAFAQGHFAECGDLVQQSLTISQQIGDAWGVACCLSNLGDVAVQLADYTTAQSYYQQALQTSLDIQAMPMAISTLTSAILLMVRQQLWQPALLIAGFIGQHPGLDGYDQTRRDDFLAQLATAVDSQTITTNLHTGAQLTMEQMQALLAQTYSPTKKEPPHE
jgi:serine/threonine protein kinase/tetratricopeptide (TPR) repeat protein